MDKEKEEQKNDIILVVKKAIGDKVEIDDIIDSEDVDIIAKKVADRLYMDGWRKENPQYKNTNEEKQIEELAKDIYAIEKTMPKCLKWNCEDCRYEKYRYKQYFNCAFIRKAEEFYNKGYRKQSDIVREVFQTLYYRTQNYHGDRIILTSNDIKELAEKYGVKID